MPSAAEPGSTGLESEPSAVDGAAAAAGVVFHGQQSVHDAPVVQAPKHQQAQQAEQLSAAVGAGTPAAPPATWQPASAAAAEVQRRFLQDQTWEGLQQQRLAMARQDSLMPFEINPRDLVVGERLALGGFAEVFAGRYQGTAVAIKLLLSVDEQGQESFRSEGGVAAAGADATVHALPCRWRDRPAHVVPGSPWRSGHASHELVSAPYLRPHAAVHLLERLRHPNIGARRMRSPFASFVQLQRAGTRGTPMPGPAHASVQLAASVESNPLPPLFASCPCPPRSAVHGCLHPPLPGHCLRVHGARLAVPPAAPRRRPPAAAQAAALGGGGGGARHGLPSLSHPAAAAPGLKIPKVSSRGRRHCCAMPWKTVASGSSTEALLAAAAPCRRCCTPLRAWCCSIVGATIRTPLAQTHEPPSTPTPPPPTSHAPPAHSHAPAPNAPLLPCCSILLDDRWRVKIADFGLSRLKSNASGVQGTAAGTPGEQRRAAGCSGQPTTTGTQPVCCGECPGAHTVQSCHPRLAPCHPAACAKPALCLAHLAPLGLAFRVDGARGPSIRGLRRAC